MSPLARTDEDDVRSMIAFRTSAVYEMMLSLGALHNPCPRHESWSQRLRAKLPPDLLLDVDSLYNSFENGILIMELAVDYPDHLDVPGFLTYVEQMSTPRFLFYALGRLAPPEEMEKLEPTVESLVSLIPIAFPEGSPRTESRFRMDEFLELVARPEEYRKRMLTLWRRYWDSYFAEGLKQYAALWDESIAEKARALASQDALEFVRTLADHHELPEQIPPGYSTGEILLVPSYFARRPLMFFGYGSVTIIYDCQLTELRRQLLGVLEHGILDVTKALGDKTRLQLLKLMVRDPQLYGRELSKLCHVSQPSVSRHLRILKEAGLVEEKPVANHITYQVMRERIEKLAPQLISYLYEEG
jgi:DNA-binding transcriptional ArsR family regulator